MFLEVKVIVNASKCEVTPLNEQNTAFKIRLTQPARDGRANKQLVELLANYFAVPKKRVKISSGEHSRIKKIEVDLHG